MTYNLEWREYYFLQTPLLPEICRITRVDGDESWWIFRGYVISLTGSMPVVGVKSPSPAGSGSLLRQDGKKYSNYSPFTTTPKFQLKIADKVASSGYFVLVPDFFHGDPYIPENGKPIPEWLKSHTPEKGFEEAKPVIAALKEKGVSAVGAAGYCWGAKVVVELAKAHEIQAAVMLHPSFVTVDDVKEVKCPISILGAEIDKMSPPELVKQFEQVLSVNSGVGHFVKIFPGVAHGWSVRYSHDDAAAVKSAQEAFADMLDWFNKNLK